MQSSVSTFLRTFLRTFCPLFSAQNLSLFQILNRAEQCLHFEGPLPRAETSSTSSDLIWPSIHVLNCDSTFSRPCPNETFNLLASNLIHPLKMKYRINVENICTSESIPGALLALMSTAPGFWILAQFLTSAFSWEEIWAAALPKLLTSLFIHSAQLGLEIG